MAALTAIATVGLLAGLANSAYQVKNQIDANKQAKQGAQDQLDATNKLTGEAKANADANAQSAINAGILAQNKARQLALSAGAGGRGSTILTSPLGATGTPNAPGKTLLGM